MKIEKAFQYYRYHLEQQYRSYCSFFDYQKEKSLSKWLSFLKYINDPQFQKKSLFFHRPHYLEDTDTIRQTILSYFYEHMDITPESWQRYLQRNEDLDALPYSKSLMRLMYQQPASLKKTDHTYQWSFVESDFEDYITTIAQYDSEQLIQSMHGRDPNRYVIPLLKTAHQNDCFEYVMSYLNTLQEPLCHDVFDDVQTYLPNNCSFRRNPLLCSPHGYAFIFDDITFNHTRFQDHYLYIAIREGFYDPQYYPPFHLDTKLLSKIANYYITKALSIQHITSYLVNQPIQHIVTFLNMLPPTLYNELTTELQWSNDHNMMAEWTPDTTLKKLRQTQRQRSHVEESTLHFE